uniref:Uncharacterized protein n=1 Tax=Hyaloperonospora arabidopsidis (strain Emoy2) TaxID=559515 RepID=M4BXS3_HYAAE
MVIDASGPPANPVERQVPPHRPTLRGVGLSGIPSPVRPEHIFEVSLVMMTKFRYHGGAFVPRFWDIETGRCLYVSTLRHAIISISFHPSGDILAIASGTCVYTWDYQVTKLGMTQEAVCND